MTIRIMLRRSSLVALALGALLSCSGDKSPTDPGKDGKDDTPQPTSLVLSNDALAFAALGDSARLEATVRDQNNFPVPDADITWSSTDTAIAKVNTNGWVSAVANGTARIIATSGALADTATIEVAQAPATIELGTDSVSLAPGDTMRLAGVVSDANGAEIPDAEITWASEDENVAAVDDGGLVTGTSAGETLIMANAGEVADTVVVVVEPQPAEITVSPGLLVFDALGDSVLVTAVVHDSEGTVMEDAAIHLTSTDSAVAMVSEDGWVVSRGNGTARIIVSSGEFSDTAQVEVAQVPVTLALAPETLQFTALLDSTRLVPTVSDRRGFAIPDPSVVWTSTDSAIASVDDDGWVISRGNGDVQIEATVGALTATVPVAVSQVIARIAVTPEATRLGTGDTVRLGATFVDSNDVEVEDVVATIVWQSADPLIASVDPTTGLVTAHRPGGATTITAQAGAHTGTADLSVKDQVAFTRASRIWLMNEDGTGQVQLTLPLGDRLPVWAPDGSKIAFTSTRDVAGKLEIYVMNADGSGRRGSPTRQVTTGIHPGRRMVARSQSSAIWAAATPKFS